LGAGYNIVVLSGENAGRAAGEFVVSYGLAVLTYNLDVKFLGWEVSKSLKR
jgi:hypothetical protein